MSNRESHESRPQQADKAHESGDKQTHPLAHIAADALTNPFSKIPSASQANEAGLPKDFANHKSFDFSSASCPYGEKATSQKQGRNTVDSRPLGGAHTATDGGANTATHVDSVSTGDPNLKPQGETKPAFSSQRPDVSNKPDQGETKPGLLSQKPDFSNNTDNKYADGKKENNDAKESGQYDKSKEAGRREYGDKPAAAAPSQSSDLEPVVQPIPDPPESTPTNSKPSDSKPSDSRPADSKPESANKPAGSQSSSSPFDQFSEAFLNAIGYR